MYLLFGPIEEIVMNTCEKNDPDFNDDNFNDIGQNCQGPFDINTKCTVGKYFDMKRGSRGQPYPCQNLNFKIHIAQLTGIYMSLKWTYNVELYFVCEYVTKLCMEFK